MAGVSAGKKLIQIDIVSDTVCPWCFVGKRNLDKAFEASRDRFDFEVLCFSLCCLLLLMLMLLFFCFHHVDVVVFAFV